MRAGVGRAEAVRSRRIEAEPAIEGRIAEDEDGVPALVPCTRQPSRTITLPTPDR